MTMMKVYRSEQGDVINLGEWDLAEEIIKKDDDTYETVYHNPLPQGATFKDEEVIVGWDGGLYVENDPRAKGPK